jgi:hypothetical protein
MKNIIALIALIALIVSVSLFTGCSGTSITPAQINAAEAAATPVVQALAAKYPSDTAAIDAAWGIATALTQGAPVSTATSPVLAALPPGTSSGTAVAALNTAIAIIGTPGATQAARAGHLEQFVKAHRKEILEHGFAHRQPSQRVLETEADAIVSPDPRLLAGKLGSSYFENKH